MAGVFFAVGALVAAFFTGGALADDFFESAFAAGLAAGSFASAGAASLAAAAFPDLPDLAGAFFAGGSGFAGRSGVESAKACRAWYAATRRSAESSFAIHVEASDSLASAEITPASCSFSSMRRSIGMTECLKRSSSVRCATNAGRSGIPSR